MTASRARAASAAQRSSCPVCGDAGPAGLLEIPACLGAKHSSLSRELEWQRLTLRDAKRPGFRVLTGNDLAIDMVMYGSDYLLGFREEVDAGAVALARLIMGRI